jgi:hypothetical protein
VGIFFLNDIADSIFLSITSWLPFCGASVFTQ